MNRANIYQYGAVNSWQNGSQIFHDCDVFVGGTGRSVDDQNVSIHPRDVRQKLETNHTGYQNNKKC